jgi:serine/threonine-protein kinase
MKNPSKFGKFNLRSENTLLRRFGPFMLYGLITLLVVVLYLDNHRFLASIELGIQDVMVSLARENQTPPEVVVVNIDDAAVAKLGPWPWDSERVGYLVGMLAEYQPKAIGLDVELPSDLMEDPQGNLFLAEMIHRAGNVVLPLQFTLTSDGRFTQTAPDYVAKSSLVVIDEAARLLDFPYPQSLNATIPYPEACKAAWGLGHVNTWQDVDGKVRRDPLVVNYEGHYYPSMALQLARAATGVNRLQVKIDPGEAITLGPNTIPTDEAGMLHVDYRGPAGTLASVSAAKVLEGADDLQVLNGRVVVVGVTASGYGTTLRTSASDDFPRAEKLATVTANILANRYITTMTLSAFLDLFVLMLIGVFCAVVLPRVGLVSRLIVLVVMGFLFLNVNYVLYSSLKLVTNTLYPTIEILLFLAFAPFVKPRELATSSGLTTSLKSVKTAGVTTNSDRVATQRPIPAMPQEAPTVAFDKSPDTAQMNRSPLPPIPAPARLTSGGHEFNAGITLTPTFEPPSDEPAATNGNPVELDPTPEPIDFSSSPASSGAFGMNSGSGSFAVNSSSGSFATNSGPNLADLRRLGRYEIQNVLGQGAMGMVFKGLDPAIDRMVALKTIRTAGGMNPAQTMELRERLVREAKAAGKLSHPNIVTIYDVGTEGDLDYIAMEYLEGTTLEDLIRKKTVTNFRIVAKMLHQVCAALDYAHKMGIVHRDIKPANIMVLEDFHVKVTDFGIARFESGAMSMTQTGIAMGTPYYIAPEQLRGEAVDRRCDIFSLGVVAYELLTRKRPFDGQNISALIYAITQTNPDPPSKLDPVVPGLFDFVISKALAKDPRQRYQNADDMGKDLEAFVEDMAGAKTYRR